MKKKHIISIAAAVAVGIVGAGANFIHRGSEHAENQHHIAHCRYEALLDAAEESRLELKEQEMNIGTYSLDDLGLSESVTGEILRQFSPADQMDDEAFSALSLSARIDYGKKDHDVSPVLLDAGKADLEKPLYDLLSLPRQRAQDACIVFEDTGYAVQSEVTGSELIPERAEQALRAALSGAEIKEDQPLTLEVDMADCGCYVQPEITAENTGFDFEARLQEDLKLYSLSVRLGTPYGKTLRLSGAQIRSFLSVLPDGSLRADREALSEYADALAQEYDLTNTQYRFQSYSAGLAKITFLTGYNYSLQRSELTDSLCDALEHLRPGTVQAEFSCTDRNGAPFSIGDTYIEVDRHNQKMSFFQNGTVVLSTDVVTGNPDGHATPKGLFSAQDKATDCTLTGPDFCVHVDFWIRITGSYGIHDANWRDIFGGERYLLAGSHGCVNTPHEAMEILYELAEVGTPILIFDYDPTRD